LNVRVVLLPVVEEKLESRADLANDEVRAIERAE